MKRVILTLAVLGVLSVTAGQAMAAGLKVRSSRGIPILGQASSRGHDSGHGNSSRHSPPAARSSHYGGNHGSSHYQSPRHGQSNYGQLYYGQPYYGQPYVRPPIVVYPGMYYGMNPYYAMPYRGFTYNGRGLSLSFGF